MQAHTHKSKAPLLLGRNHESLVLSVEDNVLSSEHDVAVDLEVGATVTLDTTEAGVGVHLGEGDGVTGNHGHVRWAHSDAEVWKNGVAGVSEAAYLGIVGCTLDLCVVGVCDLGVDEEEGSTGVCFIGLEKIT
jgi:hypothetical protein